MPIDPNIALSAQVPQINPMQSFAQGQNIALQQENMRALAEQRQAMAQQRLEQAQKLQRDNDTWQQFTQSLAAGKGVRQASMDYANDPANHATFAIPSLTKYFDDTEKNAAEIHEKQALISKTNDELNTNYLNHRGHAANMLLGIGEKDPSLLPKAAAMAAMDYATAFPQEKERAASEYQRLMGMSPVDQLAELQSWRSNAPYYQKQQEQEAQPFTLAPGAERVVGGNVTLKNPANEKDQYQKGLLDGKEVTYFINPDTHKETLPTGEDITGRVKPMPAAAMRVEMTGPQGPQTYTADRPTPETANTVNAEMAKGTGKTPNAVWQEALLYGMSGHYLTSGLGNQPETKTFRSAVDSISSAIAEKANTNLAAVQQEYKANSAALNKLTPQITGTNIAAGTALDNLKLAADESPKVSRTDSAWVNQIANAFVKGATPAAQLTKFETYIYAASREYAKVMSGGAGSVQALSDSAAGEASKLLNAAQSPEAFRAAMEAMQNDMDNYRKNQLKGLRDLGGYNAQPNLARFVAAAYNVPMPEAETKTPPPTVPAGRGGGPGPGPGQEPKPDANGFIYAKDQNGKIVKARPGQALLPGMTYVKGPTG